MRRSTPCVGICSTTYGDLVCRGCKRFAHEIIAWNGYDSSQKDQVWSRLELIRDQVVGQWLTVADETLFKQSPLGSADVDAEAIYTVLTRLVAKGNNLESVGLASQIEVWSEEHQSDEKFGEALEILQRIDKEIFHRSQAHYERNFRVTS